MLACSGSGSSVVESVCTGMSPFCLIALRFVKVGTLTLFLNCSILTNSQTCISLVLIVTSTSEDDLMTAKHGVELFYLLYLTTFIARRLNILLLILLFTLVNRIKNFVKVGLLFVLSFAYITIATGRRYLMDILLMEGLDQVLILNLNLLMSLSTAASRSLSRLQGG